MKEIKITGTKWYVDIEYEGNIARFDGELGNNGFYARKDSVTWICHKGFVTDESREEFIRKVQKNRTKFPVFFVDEKGELFSRTCPQIGKKRDRGVKFDILNIEKGRIDIELHGKIARFGGELRDSGFNVNIKKMELLSPEKRKGTYEENVAFIKELKKVYRKEPRENRKRFQLEFYKRKDGE